MKVENSTADSNQEKIAALAYALWEKDGSPHGRDRDHWYRAEQEVMGAATSAAGDSEATASSPNPTAPSDTLRAKPTSAAPRTDRGKTTSPVGTVKVGTARGGR